MLQKIGAEFLKRRLLIWMSGQARNDAPVLIPFVRVGLLGVAAAITGGLLITLACMGLLGAFYLWMNSTSVGLSPALALLATSGVTLVLVFVIFLTVQQIFKRRINAVSAALAAAPPPVQIDDAVIEVPRAIIAGFLQGILGEDSETTHRSHS